MSTAYSTFRVLIVDADKFSRDLLKEVLEALGFEGKNIFRIEDGAEALETLRIKKVNVVICDRNMGTIDGVDFVRKLRDPKKSPALGVPVIFCSRQLDRQLVEEVREAGINEVIVKPITLGTVKSRIRILLEKPRPLVNLTNYVGPDRRRLHDDNVPRERRAKARRTNSSRPEEDAVDIP